MRRGYTVEDLHEGQGAMHTRIDTEPEAIIFDLDGVVVDSEPLKQLAHITTTARFGSHLSDDFYPRLLGQSQDAVARAAIEEARLDVSVARYNEVFAQVYAPLLQTHLEPVSGIEEALRVLVDVHHRRLGIVTSSPGAVLDSILTRLDIARCFAARVSADDVTRHKPSPDPYLEVLRRLRVEASNTVAVEDTDAGIQAAVEAGVAAIGYRHALAWHQRFASASAVTSSLSADIILDLARRAHRLPRAR
jgi:HAD superfamily hydrolase (TIGR01509 family)